MKIHEIIKDKSAVIELTEDELNMLCNAMYEALVEASTGREYRLNRQLMTAREICKYGHIDGDSLEMMGQLLMKERGNTHDDP